MATMTKLAEKMNYRPDEVAAIMDVSVDTIYRAMSSGVIAFVHVGRRHRISRAEVLKIISSGIIKTGKQRATPA
jgi:excisionase family DNA binding protein